MKLRWGIVVAFVAFGCIDLSTDPDEIVAIEFAELPWPSIVAGDTLRDATGASARLAARLFDGDGDPVSGPVEFLPQRPALRVVNGNQLVVDDTATGRAGVLASTTSIQSDIKQIEIVAAPISIAGEGTIVPLRWVVPDDPSENTSLPLTTRILSAAGSGVRSWIVTYQLEAGGRVIPANDTSQVFLVSDAGRPSYADTTDTGGRVSRRVRIRIVPGVTPPTSATITVRASYKGVALSGSPVTLVLPLSAR